MPFDRLAAFQHPPTCTPQGPAGDYVLSAAARLQEIAAEALKEVYFQDGGRRAGSLEEMRFTDIEHLEFEL